MVVVALYDFKCIVKQFLLHRIILTKLWNNYFNYSLYISIDSDIIITTDWGWRLREWDPEHSEIMQYFRDGMFGASQFRGPNQHPFNSERIRTSQDGCWAAAKFTDDAFRTSMAKMVDQIQIDNNCWEDMIDIHICTCMYKTTGVWVLVLCICIIYYMCSDMLHRYFSMQTYVCDWFNFKVCSPAVTNHEVCFFSKIFLWCTSIYILVVCTTE